MFTKRVCSGDVPVQKAGARGENKDSAEGNTPALDKAGYKRDRGDLGNQDDTGKKIKTTAEGDKVETKTSNTTALLKEANHLKML